MPASSASFQWGLSRRSFWDWFSWYIVCRFHGLWCKSLVNVTSMAALWYDVWRFLLNLDSHECILAWVFRIQGIQLFILFLCFSCVKSGDEWVTVGAPVLVVHQVQVWPDKVCTGPHYDHYEAKDRAKNDLVFTVSACDACQYVVPTVGAGDSLWQSLINLDKYFVVLWLLATSRQIQSACLGSD